MHAIAIVFAGLFSAQLHSTLEASLGYAAPFSYIQAKCLQAPCGTATSRGPAANIGAHVFVGSELRLGGVLHGTIMGDGRSVGGAASAMAAVRFGEEYFAELDVGGGYGWAWRSSDWMSGEFGFAAALAAGFQVSSEISFFGRADCVVSRPGILGFSVGAEWRP